LLPYLEQDNFAKLIDFNTAPNNFLLRPDVAQLRIPQFLCPSEVNDRPRQTATLTYYPLNYCFNEGTWFIFDPVSRRFGDAAFAPTLKAKHADILDGLSNTIGMSETKAFQPNIWDTSNPTALNIAAPLTTAALAPYFGGTLDQNGHTEKIAEVFLAEVRSGKAGDAWANTTAEFKSIQGKDTFLSFVKSKPALKAEAEFQYFQVSVTFVVLVPRLCLGTGCLPGSAGQTL
jgi:hypothetical protein